MANRLLDLRVSPGRVHGVVQPYLKPRNINVYGMMTVIASALIEWQITDTSYPVLTVTLNK